MKTHIFILLFLMVIIIIPSIEVQAMEEEQVYVIDKADMFTEEQETVYEDDLHYFEYVNGVHTYIITADSVSEKTAEKYVAKYFDAEKQGDNGTVFLMISKEDNAFRIQAYGSVEDKEITKEEVEHMTEILSPMIAKKEYDQAIEKYGKMLESSLYTPLWWQKFSDGLDKNADGMEKGTYIVGMILNVVMSVGISLLIVLPFMKHYKKKLTSVEYKESARNYIKPGSITVTRKDDILLYRKKHAIPRA